MRPSKLVEADIESIVKDVRALILDKMKQHGRVIRDLNAGRVELDGINAEFVQRIWPIIVAPNGLFQTPTLWAWIHQNSRHYLEFVKAEVPQAVQPLVLLDLEEYEAMMGLGRQNSNLIGMLEEKTSEPRRERDFKACLVDKGLDDDLIGHDFAGPLVQAFVFKVDATSERRSHRSSAPASAECGNTRRS